MLESRHYTGFGIDMKQPTKRNNLFLFSLQVTRLMLGSHGNQLLTRNLTSPARGASHLRLCGSAKTEFYSYSAQLF